MNIKYSQRINKICDPAVQNTLKIAGKKGIISLSGGIPNPALFPIKEIKTLFAKIIENDGQKVFQYNQTAGLPELRQEIALYLSKKWQKKIISDQILITSGSQQALDLLGKAFLDKNDDVLTENPTYFVALSAFNSYQVKYKTMELNKRGINIKQLENVLKKHSKQIKFAYVIPTYQNPTGICWSMNNRKEFILLAKKYQLLIVEDDPYGEIYFKRKPPPNLTELDNDNQTIYLNTYSKTFCPGLRVGYIVASKNIIEKLALIKQGMDLHSSTLSQVLVYHYIKQKVIYEKHLEKIRNYYRNNSDFMHYYLEKYLEKKGYWIHPDGGLFIWLTIPGKDCRKLYQKAIKAGVSFMPGYLFYAKNSQFNSLRLTFATASEEEIKKGIKILNDII